MTRVDPHVLNALADEERLSLLVALEEHPDLSLEDLAVRVSLTHDRTLEQWSVLGAAGLVTSFGHTYAVCSSGWVGLVEMVESMVSDDAPRAV
jgi:hypothetical protein